MLLVQIRKYLTLVFLCVPQILFAVWSPVVVDTYWYNDTINAKDTERA